MCTLLLILPDLGDPSTVPVQENITTVTLSAVSADEPQVASECSSSRCDVDMYVLHLQYNQSVSKQNMTEFKLLKPIDLL